METYFSINRYDEDGDVWEHGIYLHFGEDFTMKLNNVQELTNLIWKLQKIEKEVSERLGSNIP
jgi:hypothetical protein